MFLNIFKRKGIYIALLLVSLLVLACIVYYVLLTPAAFAPSAQQGSFELGQPPEGFGGGEGSQFPSMPEGFTPPEIGGQPSVSGAMNMLRANFPLAFAALSALALAIFAVIMLVVTGRRDKRRNHETVAGDEEIIIRKRKSGTGPYILVLAVLLAIFLALLPEPAETGSEAQIQEELVEGRVELGSISRTLVSAGCIGEGSTEAVGLVGDIRVEQWFVNHGDYVQKGQVLAQLDKDSIILAIARLTEQMSQIDGEINTSLNDVIENAIYAPARGRIKAIHAQPGVKVQDTVAEYSALMRLSLDGLMAAEIEAGENMQSGMTVAVQLSDGSFIEGRVESVFEGTALIVMSDEKAGYGEQVSIYDPQGTLLGNAPLYIHKELKVNGIAGTVQRLNVEENMLVGTDIALMVLTDTAWRGERDILTEQRREMEDELTKLFEAYNSGQITAPCNGLVAAINEDVLVEKLSSVSEPPAPGTLPSDEPGMKSYAVTVTGIENGLFTLSYSDGINQAQTQMDLSGAILFKYVEGSYIPGNITEISVGDSLLLSCYVSGGSTVLDHVVFFSNSTKPNPGDGQRPQVGQSGGISGGMSGGMSGDSGRQSSGVQGTAPAEEEEGYLIAQTILCYINPYDQAEIDISVDELDISAYKPGQTVSVSLDALPGQIFSATIRSIDPNGTNEGGNTKYTVTLGLPRTENMLSGMNASVRLNAETKENVLTLPLEAVCEEDGKVFVYTGLDPENDSLIAPREIETGLSDGERVEIVSGLSEGDKYYYRYADTIKYIFK